MYVVRRCKIGIVPSINMNASRCINYMHVLQSVLVFFIQNVPDKS